jgi:hypothetical protein
MFLNPWLLLAAGLAWLASLGGAAWWFYGAGADAEIAAHAREDRAAEKAARIAADTSAKAIAALKVQHTTIEQEVRREIETRVEYRDCRHSDEQLQRINAALTGREPEPAGGGELPRAGAADEPELRRDDGQAGGGGGPVP